MCVRASIFKLIAHHTRATAHYSWFGVFLSNVLRKISEKMMVKNLCVDNNSHLLTFFSFMNQHWPVPFMNQYWLCLLINTSIKGKYSDLYILSKFH